MRGNYNRGVPLKASKIYEQPGRVSTDHPVVGGAVADIYDGERGCFGHGDESWPTFLTGRAKVMQQIAEDLSS